MTNFDRLLNSKFNTKFIVYRDRWLQLILIVQRVEGIQKQTWITSVSIVVVIPRNFAISARSEKYSHWL